ncbi:hypothetical protein [Sphingomonas sanguinis]|uniref:Uncharacterized protein n=1 Tax=Sphingomonas sanguinis TaxID=33051 RepID=A0A147J9E2_9SPHN|nr:hypothetical protein [Sphingomonas sanguinis]KTW13559.1 hypothetical protein NS258_08830 [Sphingomonas sanguinis]
MSTTSEAFCALLDASDVASRRFNSLPSDLEEQDPVTFDQEEQAVCAASHDADLAEPTTWAEFTRLLEHMSYRGASAIDDDNANRLLLHARRLLEAPEEYRTAWDAALAEYKRLKAIFDDMPSGSDSEDEANEASLDALDTLIVDTPAPDFDALQLKMDMAQERCQDIPFSDEYAAAIRADVERLKQGVR